MNWHMLIRIQYLLKRTIALPQQKKAMKNLSIGFPRKLPTESELLEDYLKVVDHLTIKSESRLETQIEEIKQHDNMHADAISTLSDPNVGVGVAL